MRFERLVRLAKLVLVRLGSHSGPSTLFAMNAMLNFLSVGQWMTTHNMAPRRVFNFRPELFEAAAQGIRDKRVLYLEFGVYKGNTTKLWTSLLKNENSHLHGFDSFEGLPEVWSPLYRKGHFSREGCVPLVDDPRVRFFRGWFEETLPKYVLPEHELLFINIDSDLYSSARTVLKYMKPHIVEGSYLYFDEFHHRDHEMKAFDEFLVDTGYKFELAGAVKTMDQVLFRRIA